MRPPNPSLMTVGLLLSSLTMLPAQAHKTEVAGDVAGTWHLEPNHSPKAGEPARVWVALTQQGGQVIPLEQCDCTLAVYATNQAGGEPIAQPPLQAMSPERFQNIPGADITFPDLGEYRIVLTGSPRAEATFAPFELSYTTVVAAGSPSPTPTQAAAPEVVPEDGAGGRYPYWIFIGGSGVAAIAALALGLSRSKSPN
ncbi:hypothetical protein VB780_09235 [Leptolyngbya sp. CCNP1308]|uniref:hypothetical protein n=1 Tax=Leptolyngbya sp. CCNP1308 TaxID=3110255 RepID=UPI002B21D27A|nr:hypothetical protein [Leptolyngbya sp. CCNP1308]MEA5448748.1 hypothetical protein [Leptolyngbya sp. CCNP1308]